MFWKLNLNHIISLGGRDFVLFSNSFIELHSSAFSMTFSSYNIVSTWFLAFIHFYLILLLFLASSRRKGFLSPFFGVLCVCLHVSGVFSSCFCFNCDLLLYFIAICFFGSLLLFQCGGYLQYPLGLTQCLVYWLSLWNKNQKFFFPPRIMMFLRVWKSSRTGYAFDVSVLLLLKR